MLLTLLIAAMLPGASPNLLPDPGFERGQWELARWDYGKSKHEWATPGRTGDQCIRLVGISDATGRINELAISPVLQVSGGARYVFAVWYRSLGDARPSLSFVSFAEPFREKGWKTPRLQYQSIYLQPSTEWRLALWRFRTASRAVEMRVMVRMSGKGEVLYDDASLVLSEGYRLEPSLKGDLCRLPDLRVFEAAVTVPGGEEWTLALMTPEGQEVARTEGHGTAHAVKVRFVSPASQQLIAALKVHNAIAEYARFHTPPVLELSLQSPRYRNAIFQSTAHSTVTARLTAHALPQVYRGFRYTASICRSGSCPPATTWETMDRPEETIRLPAGLLSPGKWRLLVRLSGVPAMEQLEVPLRVLPPGKPHEVTIDEHNRLCVDGRPVFPRGFYGAPDNANLVRPIAEAGYNTVLTYSQNPDWCRRWLDMCGDLGLWGIVHVPRAFVGRFDEQKLRAALRVVKNHPALLAYYLIDEPQPDRPGQSPAELKRVYDVIVDEDPYHPVTICINIPTYEKLYMDCYDILMIDVYPVRFHPQPLATIADRMDHAWASTGAQKPVWFIPQTFGWDVVEGLDREPVWLTPSPEQEQAMQYLALTHGARGSIAYCYHVYTRYDAEAKKKGKWPWVLGGYLPQKQPKLWKALERLGSEYVQLEQALLQPRCTTRVLAGGRLHVAWFESGGQQGDTWLLAVNADEKKSVRGLLPVSPPGDRPPTRAATPTRARDVFSGRGLPIRDGRISLTLPPMGRAAILVQN